jgi:fumarate reductase subunit C
MEDEMKETANYTPYHPRWYRKRVSTYWWTSQWRYLKFILRELSSFSVAYFVVLTLILLDALSHGPESYALFRDWLKTPLAIALNLIGLLFALYHTITWFNLAPRAMPVRMNGKRLPDWMVAASNFAVWIIISVVVAWIILGGN